MQQKLMEVDAMKVEIAAKELKMLRIIRHNQNLK